MKSKKEEYITEQERTLSALRNVFPIYKALYGFIPNTQSSKGVNRAQNLSKLRPFFVNTICLRRVLLLVTQDQPAFCGVHLMVMCHLM